MPGASPRGGPERTQRVERLRALLVVPHPHDVGHRGPVDAQQRPVAERRAQLDRAVLDRRRRRDAGNGPERTRRSPRAGRAPCGRGRQPDVGAGRVRGLVALAARPGRGVRGGERAERRREDQQERGAGVAQRPAGDLAPGERRHEPPAADEDAFGELGQARDEPHREDGPGEQPDRRCRDQQRVDAQRAARGAGDRRAVQAELDERDDRQQDEREVEPQPLGQRPADLPPDRGPDAGDRRARQQRRDRQRDDRERAADERDRERAPARAAASRARRPRARG